jgi:uncharacterized membrane protein YcaP (DUF421 family)
VDRVNYSWIWQATIIFFIGILILRVGGRKSISQMTISQTVVMVGLGSLIIQPVTGRGLFITLLIALLLVLLMNILEYLEVKVDILEKFFSGRAIMVISNGKPDMKNLKKLRLSIDRLETRLRQAGISSIEDVKYATIEVSGQLGYELKDNKKPLTREDFATMMSEIAQLRNLVQNNIQFKVSNNQKNNIFA